MFISIDPGKNVGVATFNDDGTDRKKMILDITKFRSLFLRSIHTLVATHPEIKVTWIMEDYRLRRDKALDQTGSDMPAPRCIGAVEMMHDLIGEQQSTLVFQRPGILYTALKWAGYKQFAKRNVHPPDDIAAYSHGVFYLIDNDYRKHPLFDE